MNRLQDTIMEKWQNLNLREQAWALACGAVAIVLLVWLILFKPLQSAVAAQQRQNQATVASLQHVRQLAGQLKQLQATGGGEASRETNLTQLVDSSLRQNNLRMSGFQPGSDGSVSLRFDNARFDALLQWLYEMEIGQGVVLSELSVRQGGTPGEVAATVRLRKAQ